MRARPDFQVHLDPDELKLLELAGGAAGGKPADGRGAGGAVPRHGGRGGGKVRTTAAAGRRQYAFRRS
ncbi:hypothetical protein [Spirilliplanes yamanashiensis]|uniref:Uncharacterized protein n=1 Tax=Spirilliplanes yamanashiensis TaxID=42233 RepID=A0A8J3YB89_9ACTN|nr:hypothetical protein [Spirilliplanes yamanashiensis]MDP9817743.1 hypothetical protein [Spirilliplanes yamanashiensis]GIJ04553.1 hypothetical protein Sya03_39050 [Spirilliplanes yamanashiensis]